MIYIDPNTFRCYVAQNDEGTRIPFEDAFFDGKCQDFVEGYCCVPVGYNWVGRDGTVYPGGMIFPWEDYEKLKSAQQEYEKQLLAEYAEALAILEVIQ